MVGPYHLELVAKNNKTPLYVINHADREFSTEGGTGKAAAPRQLAGRTRPEKRRDV